MANTFVALATVTVGSGGAANIEFTSIPQTYTDLAIRLSARASFSALTGNMAIEFNGSSASFSRRTLRGNGSAASSTSGSDNYVGDAVGNSATASTFSNNEIYIPNYTTSNNKSFSTDSVTENNGTEAWQYLIAGLWSNSAAITSIKLLPFSQSWTFLQYSTATLYGIKNS